MSNLEPAVGSNPTQLIVLTREQLSEIIRHELAVHQYSTPASIPIQQSKTELMTREQVATLFGVSNPTLIEWNKNGVLPCLHFGRSVRYNSKVVEKLLNAKKGNEYE